MRFPLFTLLAVLLTSIASATTLQGLITNLQGQPLPFATVLIKGTTIGTTANASGAYSLELAPGHYTIICQYIGYKRTEGEVDIAGVTFPMNIVLSPLKLQIKEVVVKANGEDPAYAIIRQAIKKRNFYNTQLKEYTTDAYIKGMFKTRSTPSKFFGKKVDKADMGVDSAGKGILFLSESITKVSYQAPDHLKLEVISSRQSGGGLGISFPTFINFYDNNVTAVITQLSPRGFISPVAENALAYYKYHYIGSFVEDGKTVNKIEVIPKRTQEPLFSGHIFITDDDWRIHSLDLRLTKNYGLDLMDTLTIRQTHVPVSAEVWRTKDQVVYFSLQKFGFDVVGQFVNVYSNYNLHPNFPKDFFKSRVLMRYDTAFDKKRIGYWDSVRPIPLEKEELKDFHEKDSTAQARRDAARSRYALDTLRKNQRPPSVGGITWSGATHHFFYYQQDSSITSTTLFMKGLLQNVEYNTVEGLVAKVSGSITVPLEEDSKLEVLPVFRYGFSNTHFNAYADINYVRRKRLSATSDTWNISGGKRVSQFNHAVPIVPLINEVYTLFLKENYMKLYENWYGSAGYTHRFESTLLLGAKVTYEDRMPLENTTDFTLFKNAHKQFLPNHPYELANLPFQREQAFLLEVRASYQPGQTFVEFPVSKVAIGSKWPTFSAIYTKGIHGIAGSDADFDKWNFSINDKQNLKLFGEFRYHVGVGGFFNNKYVGIPDLQHFIGNQTVLSTAYLNSFQLAPYYRYSTSAPFYATANIEHHFNGLLTNKIPLFNKLKWNLVAGANAFYVNGDNNYVEAFAGLENIFKVLRVDVVAGYQSQAKTRIGIRVGLGGLLGGLFTLGNGGAN
ncbi:CarboxypepD_reg-like domain-containing protein [Chitinophaga costaii]|uniref:CarboxypepD_reg-like domain-containing protein n=1 Tax=Chitinophaga costaii TaxID=1335309 RepID=A0A1C4FHY2_9BACT|nr:DUF5686 and carboxypeptidase regulatory-like domain-containing protein [Chitinophaga costaii]PUZ20287.1 carboxypeptidase-like regulatory domain-containing protein [Chitinophaga costaii]SCC55464.1 CarboxypepD_reg-like domain-containing protein [Chitinophaga costaii]